MPKGIPGSQTRCTVEGCEKTARVRGLCSMHHTRWLKYGDVNANKKSRPVLERFWEKVEKTDTCWLWTGATSTGYGYFAQAPRSMVYAHRFSYEQTHGPIADGLVVNHLCRTPACVRPDHLEAVTQRQNVLYSDGVLGIRSARTHCPKGHPYTQDNLLASKDGFRRCKECHRLLEAAKRQR